VPTVQGVRIDTSELRLNDQPCNNWDAEWVPPRAQDEATGVTVVLQGAYPRQCRRADEMQLVDRTRYAGLVFAQGWREMGGQWAGTVREAAVPAEPAARVLAERRSRPWGEVLRPLIKTSDNTLARLLFLELGVPGMAQAPQARTIDLARAAVQRWFADKGLPAQGLVMDNGSGLSRSERISPMAMARLVEWVWGSRHAPDLLMALPVAGVDGTLRNRLKASPATGLARLKTGSLKNVAALAGVVKDPRGRPWAVALMVNHDSGPSAARPVLDAFIDDFARHGPCLGRAPRCAARP
jgi:D-alanyl-D-alanine carboxypeptidase/D-alanyl-D-alanine-endopeptidase (penicillin-binding protein 4)